MIRKIGLWMCPLGFGGMLLALSIDNLSLIISEGVLMITGAVLSLHPQPKPAPDLQIRGALHPPSSADIARMTERIVKRAHEDGRPAR